VYFLATQGIPTLGDRSHDASMPKNNSIHISVLIELGLMTDRQTQTAGHSHCASVRRAG